MPVLSANTFWVIFIGRRFHASALGTLPAGAARTVLALTVFIVDKKSGVCGMHFPPLNNTEMEGAWRPLLCTIYLGLRGRVSWVESGDF